MYNSYHMWNGVIQQYKDYLPVGKYTPVVTMNEGNTPLIYSQNLSKFVNADVYLKYEGVNPTGSFKDRGMTLAVSKAKEEKATAVICASTGNTSASASAYAARAGLRSIVLVPQGAIALGKLSQALIHGATVLQINGNFDDALGLVKEISAKYPITLVNSLNPYRIEGQKTAAFEICDALGSAPDFQVMPVGNAGNITAYWKGYKEYGPNITLPRMLGFQAEGAAPIVKGRIVKRPQTIASAIRIGNPASWKKAEQVRDESAGLIDTVTDKQILEAYKFLAQKEGVFVEPASAASVAGLLKLAKKGYFSRQWRKNAGKQTAEDSIKFSGVNKGAGQRLKAKIVCILTGHGLKDADMAIKIAKKPRIVRPKIESVVKEIGY